MSILDSLISPDWLKYGFTGLVAIFAILMFFIIKPLTQTETNKKFWIVLFIVVSFVLLGTGGLYVYSNDTSNITHSREIDSLNLKISDLEGKLKIINGKTPEIESLQKNIESNKHILDSLSVANKDFEESIQKQSDLIKEIISSSILESFQQDWQLFNPNDFIGVKDLTYKRLRRAVFLNFSKFNADKGVLEHTLLALQKTTGGIQTSDIKRVLMDYPNLMRLKIQWLRTEVIPPLGGSYSFWKKVQASPSVTINLPREIWLKESGAEIDHATTFTDLTAVKKEVALIERKLISL